MSSHLKKCVLVIRDDLPRGLQVNTAAVLALSIGKRAPDVVGPDVEDATGALHSGITTIPIPILKADEKTIRSIAEAGWALTNRSPKAAEQDLYLVDVTDAAQTTKDYRSYREKLLTTPSEKLRYLGIALYGAEAAVRSLTGSLGLLR